MAGGRRLAALKQLAKQKRIARDYDVLCLCVADASARTVSLTENVQREAMHPADQFEAFAALLKEGRSVEDVAADFGVTPQVVLRRLKLANVSPRLLADYRAGAVTLDQLMALAITDDHAAQDAAFYDAPEWRRGPDDRSLRRWNCWMTAPPCPSSRAIARKPPAAWTIPCCAIWKCAWVICANSKNAVAPSLNPSRSRASSRPNCNRKSPRPTPSSAWKTCTRRTSPSAAPAPRSIRLSAGRRTVVLALAVLANAPAVAQHAQADAQPGVQTLPALTVTGGHLADETDGPVQGYVAEESRIGTKTRTSVLETPQSISVVTREQMDMQQAASTSQALRYTAGASSEKYGGFGG